MGFKNGTYATIWTVEPKSETITKARISISRKNKTTGQYDTDFSGFVTFMGSAVARKAASLKERDRIRLGDVDVSNYFNKEKNITYTDFKVFSFDMADEVAPASVAPQSNPVDGGEEVDESNLPF